MKGDSEDKVRLALHEIEDALVYKPPDDARNWKPCDFMVWRRGYATTSPTGLAVLVPLSVWIEVKDNPQLGRWPLADLRPSQRQGIAAAHDVGMRYWIVIWWRRQATWTISDGWLILQLARAQRSTSLSFDELRSTLGIDAEPRLLGSTLRTMLEDG